MLKEFSEFKHPSLQHSTGCNHICYSFDDRREDFLRKWVGVLDNIFSVGNDVFAHLAGSTVSL